MEPSIQMQVNIPDMSKSGLQEQTDLRCSRNLSAKFNHRQYGGGGMELPDDIFPKMVTEVLGGSR